VLSTGVRVSGPGGVWSCCLLSCNTRPHSRSDQTPKTENTSTAGCRVLLASVLNAMLCSITAVHSSAQEIVTWARHCSRSSPPAREVWPLAYGVPSNAGSLPPLKRVAAAACGGETWTNAGIGRFGGGLNGGSVILVSWSLAPRSVRCGCCVAGECCERHAALNYSSSAQGSSPAAQEVACGAPHPSYPGSLPPLRLQRRAQ
jgi:hypothetical protein